MRLDHLLSMENRNPINARLRTDSYSDIVPAERAGRWIKGQRGKLREASTGKASAERSCCSIVSDRPQRNLQIIETVKANPLWGCSPAGRAPALQAGGQGFDSLHLHQRQCRTRSPREESKERKEVPAFATRSDTEVRLKMNRINNHREITVCSSGG